MSQLNRRYGALCLLAAGAIAGCHRQGQLTPGSGVLTNLSGNRAYWTSDFMAQQRPGYVASVRMISSRI